MRGGPPADPGINPVKAFAVIFVLVVVGIVVLKGTSPGKVTTSAGKTTTTVHHHGSTTTTLAKGSGGSVAPTTTVVPPAQIKVQVLNGLRSGSLSSQWNANLKRKGYQTGLADDATVLTPNSIIYILTPGYQAEADSLAQSIGLPLSSVDPTVPPPASAPIPSYERTSANLVLVIGHDLAASATSG
jgi:hypothetical protein